MIIDAKTIVITLFVVVIALVWGLKFIRRFALQIAQENHDAVFAMDQQEETKRLKKERAADLAAATAFAKVEPMLTVSKVAPPAKTPPAQVSPTASAEAMV
jgi:hypothetical protein